MELYRYKTKYQKCPVCSYEYQGEIIEKCFNIKEIPIIGDKKFM